ncbi:MAG TPA: response regulator, partial [Opitutaceae bacterium]|nr:response regulator [Opitutaceae bacterium]
MTSESEYRVSFAEDGEDAWTLLSDRSHSYDLCIIDIMMPRVSGFVLIERIRDTLWLKHIPLMICTAAKDRVNIQKAASLLVRNYLVKPYTRLGVLEKIRATMNTCVNV